MKRRFLSLALVLATVFVLCACSQNDTATVIDLKQRLQEGEQKLESVENCHLVLQLSINPQLELYLDEDGTVLQAVAGNKDGERLLAALKLTDLSYSDAMRAILDGAKDQGFLAVNTKIQIDVLSSASGPLTLEQTQQLEQVITDYDKALLASVDQSTVVAAHCGANTLKIEELENGDLFYSYYTNKKLVREIRYSADGSYTEWVYQDGNTTDVLTIDAAGNRQEEHTTSHSNGNIKTHHVISIKGTSFVEEFTQYDENGLRQAAKVTHSDGTSLEESSEENYENGILRTRKHFLRNGNVLDESFEEYDENGKLKTSKSTHTDGSIVAESFYEYEYYANGNQKTEKYTYSDGTVSQESFEEYYENGNLRSQKSSSTDGPVVEESFEEYYENGNLKTVHSTRTDGSLVEEYFAECYENGNLKTRHSTRTDGTSSEESFEEFYANGNVKTSKTVHSDGTVFEVHYDENGSRISYTESGNGNRVERTYYPNGNLKTQQIINNEGTTFEEYYEHGTLMTQKTVHPDGSTSETHCGENGNTIYSVESSNGNRVERTYYPDGKLKTLEEYCPNGVDHVYQFRSFAEDGSVHIITHRKDGSIDEAFYDKNGQLIEN